MILLNFGWMVDQQQVIPRTIFFFFLGTVTANNEAVEAAPSLINTSAMNEGWLFKVSLSKLEEVDELMTQEAYEKYLKEHEE